MTLRQLHLARDGLAAHTFQMLNLQAALYNLMRGSDKIDPIRLDAPRLVKEAWAAAEREAARKHAHVDFDMGKALSIAVFAQQAQQRAQQALPATPTSQPTEITPAAAASPWDAARAFYGRAKSG